ncbi:MAG: uridine kinase [Gaiella sp.]
MGGAREEALALVARAHAGSPFTLVGIGGRGGTGKSTLAAAIPGAQVVSTDGFWDGQRFELDRLRHEVLEPLGRGEAACFGVYDWGHGRRGGRREVTPTGVVVVEGVCALHRTLRESYAVRLWLEAPYEVRLARGIARDGESARSTWVDVWMPAEDAYVARDDPVSCAHLVVDGTR